MPGIESLRTQMQRLAAVTAVFAGEYGESQFTFDPLWGKRQQAAMHIDGCGDELYIHFTRHGCFIKGFAHESEMTPYKHPDRAVWPGVLDSVPDEFQNSLNEPAFDREATTFAIWRLSSAADWSMGDVELPSDEFKDGSGELLAPIAFSATDMTNWLTNNYETDVDADIVASVFNDRPLSVEELTKLNPSSPIHEIRDAVLATGWKITNGE